MTLPPNEPPPPIETTEPPVNPQPEAIPVAKLNKKRNKWLWITTVIILSLGLIWLLLYLFYFQYHIHTDDAYSSGNVVNVNAAVTGSVIAFYADDTDLVKQGQLLVQLDETFYQVVYDQSLAELAMAAMQVRKYAEDVEASQAAVEIRRIYLSRARYDTENRSQLVDSQAISNEDFTHSKDDLSINENELKRAEVQLQISKTLLGTTSLNQHPLIEEKKGAVRSAFYNLQHCKIYAATTGFIAKRSVNVGQSVTRTTDMMAIVPVDTVWVEANYKETELTNMRVGQPATVWFDLYGSGVKFEGKVLGISAGSGSLFSLIPPQNATGNWIKIVQRLPVRVSLDPKLFKDYPIRLGISAEVTVHTADQDLPRLQQIPSTEVVDRTNVYDLEFEQMNKQIDEIVRINLAEPKSK